MSHRIAENTRSGIKGAILGFLLYSYHFLKHTLEWALYDIVDPEHLRAYIEGLVLISSGGGGLAAYYRDRKSPKPVAEPVVQATVVDTPTRQPAQPKAQQPANNWSLSRRSESNLVGVHDDLVDVVERALELSPYDFAVTSGLRSREHQAKLVKAGASQTMRSRHLTGHAVDIAAYANGQITWENSYYEAIAKSFKRASNELDVPIEWGGDWKKFHDAVHFELDRRHYPVDLDLA